MPKMFEIYYTYPESEPMVLRHRNWDVQKYFIGALRQIPSGIWCTFHHYEGAECTEELFDTFSDAYNALRKMRGEK